MRGISKALTFPIDPQRAAHDIHFRPRFALLRRPAASEVAPAKMGAGLSLENQLGGTLNFGLDSRSASYSAARGTKCPRSREVPSAPRVFRRVAACVKSSTGPCRSARRKLPKMEGTHVHRFPKGGEEIDTDVVRRKEFEKMRMKVANEKFGKREDAKELMTRMMQACIAAFAKDPLEFMIESSPRRSRGGRSRCQRDRGNTRRRGGGPRRGGNELRTLDGVPHHRE